MPFPSTPIGHHARVDRGGEQSGSRLPGIAGLVAALLALGPAVAFIGGDFPQPGDSPVVVAHVLVAHRTRYLFGIFCEVISLGVVLWFYAGLRTLIGERAGAAARVLLAAAVSLSVLIWVEDSILAASARLADRGVAPGTVAATREVGLLVAWPSARVATVVLLLAAALAILRTHALPAGIAWFALLVAVPNAVYVGSVFVDRGALAPASNAGETLAVGLYYLWLLVASLALVQRPGHQVARP